MQLVHRVKIGHVTPAITSCIQLLISPSSSQHADMFSKRLFLFIILIAVAVNSSPDADRNPEVCTLPQIRGRCRALFPRWWYDAKTKECTPFNYGGCEGNGNNFKTKEHCLEVCAGV